MERERQRLEKLEKERLRRMRGGAGDSEEEDDEGEEDEEGGEGRADRKRRRSEPSGEGLLRGMGQGEAVWQGRWGNVVVLRAGSIGCCGYGGGWIAAVALPVVGMRGKCGGSVGSVHVSWRVSS